MLPIHFVRLWRSLEAKNLGKIGSDTGRFVHSCPLSMPFCAKHPNVYVAHTGWFSTTAAVDGLILQILILDFGIANAIISMGTFFISVGGGCMFCGDCVFDVTQSLL